MKIEKYSKSKKFLNMFNQTMNSSIIESNKLNIGKVQKSL